MTFSPQKFREMVAQALYAIEIQGDIDLSAPPSIIELLMGELKVSKRVAAQALDHALAIWKTKELVDQKISATSRDYDLARIGQMERSILRLSVASLEDLPKALVIAEAIRLTCKFSTPQAAHFVHAILDGIHQDTSRSTDDASLPS